jgi:Asp-tRNA(Asn)/Glu-tRNA(Gln) amidotransferase A subunit family amidase
MIPLAHSTDCPGIIVRSVADIGMMLQVLAGYDARDHTSALVPGDDYLGGSSMIAAPRIALMMGGEFLQKSNDEVRANVRATADKFAHAGARIDEVEPPPSLADMSEAFWRVLAAEAAAHHREEIERHPEGFDPRTRELLRKGLAMPAMKYLRALAVRREFRRDVTEILHRYDAVLVPSVPTPAPLGLDSTGDPVFNNPWSMAGNPVVGLPSGLSASGLPLAVQIVGDAFDESRLLALARWCEGVLAFAETPALMKA